ncbi:OprD family outer membrane porin [Pseudomonas sp. NPDC012596]|uniref:OprD family outer membrane porin n=1 Tax=Pseudomonas sp. NPDC012596 TaxID=3364419 RepID=UPI0036C93AC4
MYNSVRMATVLGISVLMLNSSAAVADFMSDGKASVNLRNFYYNNDNRNRSATLSKTEEWAQGFVLDYKSGYTDGTLEVGVDVLAMTAVTLDSGKGRHLNSSMIPSEHDGRAVDQWGRLGVTAKARVSATEIRSGTLIPKLPILNANDGRVLPQTFQGTQITSRDLENALLTVGRIESTTGRGSTDRTGLSVSGAPRESDHFDYAGIEWTLNKQLLAQYYVGYLQDFYTQQFVGIVNTHSFANGASLKADLRFFDTKASGANRNRVAGYQASGYSRHGDGVINNQTWAATFFYNLGAHTFTLGYQSVSDQGGFVQPNQNSLPDKGAGSPSSGTFTDRLVYAFYRAGEQTVYGGYAYDFTGMGVPGLKVSYIYLRGDNIKTAVGPDAKEWEQNLYVDYVVQSGPLSGLGLRWLQGAGRSATFGDVDQTRLVMSYSWALF